jgi:hypothetical protein
MGKTNKLLLALIPILIALNVSAQTVKPYCGPFSQHATISYSGMSNLTISGDSINCFNVAGTKAMYLNNCSHVHITKCKFTNVNSFAIDLENCTDITIDSCYFSYVGMGVYAHNSTAVKVNANYMLNINGVDASYLGHAVQFDHVNGAGNRINYNRIENVKGVAVHPHDQISVYQSNGLLGDSIQVIGNWIRGGQQYAWPTSSSGAAGIVLGDVGGSYQVARGNLLVNAMAIAADCTASNLKVDHNRIYAAQQANNSVGLLFWGSGGTNNYDGNNQINFTSANGTIINWYIFPSTPTPTAWSTNTAQHSADGSVIASMISTPMIAACTVSTPPNITYSASTQTITYGTPITNMLPVNTGGAATSYAINHALPSGLSFNTSTGQISGTPTGVAAIASYIITCTNPAGSSAFTTSITVNAAPLIITANSKTKYVGTLNPPLNVSYSGFVNGDSSASLTTLPTISTSATVASPVGSYDIVSNGAVAGNYIISYVDGKLIVYQGLGVKHHYILISN